MECSFKLKFIEKYVMRIFMMDIHILRSKVWVFFILFYGFILIKQYIKEVELPDKFLNTFLMTKYIQYLYLTKI